MSWRRATAILFAAMSLPQLSLGQVRDPITTFEHVAVVPMDRPGVVRDQTVVIENGRIVRIGDARTIAIPAGARRIDGRGRFLFPGLTDTHVHLEGRPALWAPLFLAHGVTTVFNLRGGPDQLELRRQIAAGVTPGPTVYTSGPFTNQPAIATAADAERAVAEQKAAGYDFVKIHGDLTAEAYTALIAAGNTRHLPVIGHAPRNLPFDSVIGRRQPLVVHAEELIYTKFNRLDTTEIAPVAARMASADIWLTPTLTTFHGIARQWGRPASVDTVLGLPEGTTLPPGLQEYWRKSNPYTGRGNGAQWALDAYRFQLPLVGMLYRAGVPLLTGTDTPLPVMLPGHSVHDEIAELELAGVDRQGALAAATINPGRFIRQFVDSAARFGTVTVGSRADLVLVEHDPREHLAALSHPIGVMARGRWYDRAALDGFISSAAHPPVEPAAPVVALGSEERRAFVGEFRSATGPFNAKVVDRDGTLVLEASGQGNYELVAIARRRFAAKSSVTRIEIEFSEDLKSVEVFVGGAPLTTLGRVP